MYKNYLQHDLNSRNTPLQSQIRRRHGMEGLGIYWCIAEQLYECGGHMPRDYDLLAYDLRTDATKIADIIKIAFQVTDTEIYSEQIILNLIDRVEAYNKKVEGKSKAGIASGLARKQKALINSTNNEQEVTGVEHVFVPVKQINSSVEQNELREDKGREDKGREDKLSKEKESKVKLSQVKTVEVKLSKASTKEPKIIEWSDEYIDSTFADILK